MRDENYILVFDLEIERACNGAPNRSHKRYCRFQSDYLQTTEMATMPVDLTGLVYWIRQSIGGSMKLGIVLRTTGPTPRLDLDFVLEAERLGFDSAWTSEAWGGDAVTTVSWLLARTTRIKGGTGIMQMQARTPACA